MVKLLMVGLPAAYLVGMVGVTAVYLYSFSDLAFIKALLLGTRWPILVATLVIAMGWIYTLLPVGEPGPPLSGGVAEVDTSLTASATAPVGSAVIAADRAINEVQDELRQLAGQLLNPQN